MRKKDLLVKLMVETKGAPSQGCETLLRVKRIGRTTSGVVKGLCDVLYWVAGARSRAESLSASGTSSKPPASLTRHHPCPSLLRTQNTSRLLNASELTASRRTAKFSIYFGLVALRLFLYPWGGHSEGDGLGLPPQPALVRVAATVHFFESFTARWTPDVTHSRIS